MKILSLLIVCLILIFSSCRPTTSDFQAPKPSDALENAMLIDGDRHFIDGYAPIDKDVNVQVVVEIPTGTNAKWEVDKASGDLVWEIESGQPRVVRYLGYPGNYGMIPQTLLPKEFGGDGDPLDVIVIGPAVERGTVIAAKLIGVMELLDGGEVDDKLIAVMKGTPFFEANNLSELDSTFNGIDEILQLWFSNYKGQGEIEFVKFGDELRAKEILEQAVSAYLNAKQR